jgi:hypothetical protein
MPFRSGDPATSRRRVGLPTRSPSIERAPLSGKHPRNKGSSSYIAFSLYWRRIQHQPGLLWIWSAFTFVAILIVWIGGRQVNATKSQFLSRPRVLYMKSIYQTNNWPLNSEDWPNVTEILYDTKPLPSEGKNYHSDEEKTGCPFIADWQKHQSGYHTCNQLHEVALQVGTSGKPRIQHLAAGGFKDVWRVFMEDSTPADYVLKTTLFDTSWGEYDLDKHRRDALVSEQTASSRYVLNMYAYCGFSTLVESASGTLSDWMKKFREKATVAHADIKASQFLQFGSIFKINDFNRCRFLTSKHLPDICPFVIDAKHKGSTSRSPEEYISGGLQTDKIDVFSMGSVFYYLLTGHAPFAEEPYKKAVLHINNGVHPPLPKKLSASTEPSMIAILDAMKWCRQLMAEDRPNSRQVADKLIGALSDAKAAIKTQGRG